MTDCNLWPCDPRPYLKAADRCIVRTGDGKFFAAMRWRQPGWGGWWQSEKVDTYEQAISLAEARIASKPGRYD